MSQKIIVLDTSVPFFLNNMAFDPSSERYPETNAIIYLNRIALESGWRMMTGDVFLRLRPAFERAVCISLESTNELSRLISLGVEPKILFSTESPNVAWTFYHNLGRLSKGFRHAYLFRGCLDRVDRNVKCHVHYWACLGKKINIEIDYYDRRLLTMVASFKEKFGVDRTRIVSRIISPVRWLKVLWYQTIDPLAQFPDLYEVRLQAVSSLADRKDFFLFGRRWDVAQKYLAGFRNLYFAYPPVECKDKIQTLSRSKFTLAFENCIFPGYITEKIFDAMMARTVPIYLGAPDIEDFVPKECFVDFRDYNDFDELLKDIGSWDKKKWLMKIRRIEEFLSSSLFSPFKVETVADNYFKWLTE